MDNRKARLLLLRRSPDRVKLTISNHKRALTRPFGELAFAVDYKPTASRNRRQKGYATR